jgi:hypothetical protein
MTRSLLIVSFCVALSAVGCSRSNPAGSSLSIDTTHIAIVMVDEIASSDLSTDEARIGSAVISSDVLSLLVQYGGGCKPHDFKLFGSRRFLESYPVQADVFLSHNANGDACKALISDSLRFSLQRLKETYQMSYGERGTILLRLHEPGKQAPLLPPFRYMF